MKKILVAVRLEEPYALTLRKFPNQNVRIQQGLDLIQDQPFRKELAKQKEAYDPSKDNQKDHPAAPDIRQEFADEATPNER